MFSCTMGHCRGSLSRFIYHREIQVATRAAFILQPTSYLSPAVRMKIGLTVLIDEKCDFKGVLMLVCVSCLFRQWFANMLAIRSVESACPVVVKLANAASTYLSAYVCNRNVWPWPSRPQHAVAQWDLVNPTMACSKYCTWVWKVKIWVERGFYYVSLLEATGVFMYAVHWVLGFDELIHNIKLVSCIIMLCWRSHQSLTLHWLPFLTAQVLRKSVCLFCYTLGHC